MPGAIIKDSEINHNYFIDMMARFFVVFAKLIGVTICVII